MSKLKGRYYGSDEVTKYIAVRQKVSEWLKLGRSVAIAFAVGVVAYLITPDSVGEKMVYDDYGIPILSGEFDVKQDDVQEDVGIESLPGECSVMVVDAYKVKTDELVAASHVFKVVVALDSTAGDVTYRDDTLFYSGQTDGVSVGLGVSGVEAWGYPVEIPCAGRVAVVVARVECVDCEEKGVRLRDVLSRAISEFKTGSIIMVVNAPYSQSSPFYSVLVELGMAPVAGSIQVKGGVANSVWLSPSLSDVSAYVFDGVVTARGVSVVLDFENMN